MLPRTETLARSKKYMAWIRQRPCVVTQTNQNVIAHHITVGSSRGLSQKPSDFWCIPLESSLHDKLHNMGERSFWEEQDLIPHALACLNLLYYVIYEKPEHSLDLLKELNEFAARRYVQ